MEIIILATSNLSSANAFNLVQPKILLFGKELKQRTNTRREANTDIISDSYVPIYASLLIYWGHIVFALSVSLFVSYSQKNFNIGHNFRMVSDKAFMFHMHVPCGKTFSFVPGSRSSSTVKDINQGHIFQKMAISHILFNLRFS